jgi:hypothetical protein
MNVVRKSLDCDDRWCGRMLTLTAATEADAPLSRATFALPCTAYLKSLGGEGPVMALWWEGMVSTGRQGPIIAAASNLNMDRSHRSHRWRCLQLRSEIMICV